MPNSSSTWVSRSTTASLALDRALCDRPGLEHLVGGQACRRCRRRARAARPAGGSGVCGGGSRSAFWPGGTSPGTAANASVSASGSGWRLLATRFLTSRSSSTGESYAGSPMSGSMSPSAERPRRVRIGWVGSPSSPSGSGRVRPSSRSRSSASLDGHLVDRRRGDHQHTEERRAAPAAGPRRTAYASGRAAGWRRRSRPRRRRSRRGSVSPLTGCGLPLRDVDDAEHAEAEGGPADDLATGGSVADSGRACCASRPGPARGAGTSRPCRPSRPRWCG